MTGIEGLSTTSAPQAAHSGGVRKDAHSGFIDQLLLQLVGGAELKKGQNVPGSEEGGPPEESGTYKFFQLDEDTGEEAILSLFEAGSMKGGSLGTFRSEAAAAEKPSVNNRTGVKRMEIAAETAAGSSITADGTFLIPGNESPEELSSGTRYKSAAAGIRTGKEQISGYIREMKGFPADRVTSKQFPLSADQGGSRAGTLPNAGIEPAGRDSADNQYSNRPVLRYFNDDIQMKPGGTGRQLPPAASFDSPVRYPAGTRAYSSEKETGNRIRKRSGRPEYKGAAGNIKEKGVKTDPTRIGTVPPHKMDEVIKDLNMSDEMKFAEKNMGGDQGASRAAGSGRSIPVSGTAGFEVIEQGKVIPALSERILEQAVMMRESSAARKSEIRIKLRPVELGELRISVIVKDENRVQASIITEAVQAKSIIDAGSEKLSENLFNEGFHLENLDVSVDDPGSGDDGKVWEETGIERIAEKRSTETKLRPVFKSRSGGIDCLA